MSVSRGIAKNKYPYVSSGSDYIPIGGRFTIGDKPDIYECVEFDESEHNCTNCDLNEMCNLSPAKTPLCTDTARLDGKTTIFKRV